VRRASKRSFECEARKLPAFGRHPSCRGTLYQVPGRGSDGASIRIKEVFQRRGGGASHWREPQALETQIAHALKPFRHLRDDFGGCTTRQPCGVHYEQPACPLDGFCDCFYVERTEPNRVDNLGADTDFFQVMSRA